MLQAQTNTPSSIESGRPQPEEKQNANSNNLPRLPMDLRNKKRSIAITWFILILMTSILDEFFYFVLRYGAKTSTETALTVPTAVLGMFSILTIGFRTFQLMRRGSNRRPIDGKWWAVRFVCCPEQDSFTDGY
jgi:hypothetical protein